MVRIPETAIPDLNHRSFNLTAKVDLPSSTTSGVLCTLGGRFAGFTYYFWDGYLVFHYNFVGMLSFYPVSSCLKSTRLMPCFCLSSGLNQYEVVSPQKIPAGKHTLRMIFDYDGGPPGSGE